MLQGEGQGRGYCREKGISPLLCVIVIVILFLLSGSLGVGVSAAESHADLVGPFVHRCMGMRCFDSLLTCGAVGNAVCGAAV